METFGSGNGPSAPDLLQELRAASARGLLIVNCTHCLQGTVTSDYAAGAVGQRGQGLGRKGLAEGPTVGKLPIHPLLTGHGGNRPRLRV